MRVTRAIDRFLEQMQLEADFTAASVHSYGSVLGRMVDEPPRGFGAEIRLTDLMVALQALMGHADPSTTQRYVDELRLEELDGILERAFGDRVSSVASEGDTAAGDRADAIFASDGPGRNRTYGPAVSGEAPERDGSSDDAARPLTDEERCHE